MRSVIQRVQQASVFINGDKYSEIGCGLLVLLGVEDTDTMGDVNWLVNKIGRLRIFDDEKGTMNHSVTDVGGEILVVSQFTLHASTKKGNRPSYIKASKPDHAIPLYEFFVHEMGEALGRKVATGSFGAQMKIKLINDGPVTIMIDTKNKE